MKRYKEDFGALEFFSEHVFKIDSKNFEKHKRFLIITKDTFYQLSKSLSVVLMLKLSEIKGITIIKKSMNLIVIHCPNSFDHLIEIVRRSEMVVFLLHCMSLKGIPPPQIKYANQLKLTKTNQSLLGTESKNEKILNFDPSKQESSMTTTLHNLNSFNFINSPKYGYLQKKAEGWFKSWSEKFCVMTNVGLLYYNEADDKPRNLFPTIDA